MPTYLGCLRPATDDQQSTLSNLLKSSDGIAPAAAAAPPTQQEESPKDKSKNADTPDQDAVPLSKGEQWTPSGGKKLATGLAICLENTASGMTRPCVLDIKLGARLWDDDAPEAKRRKLDEVAESSTSGSLGFRVAGMKVSIPKDGKDGDAGKEVLLEKKEEEGFVKVERGYKVYNKHYGRQFRGKEDVAVAVEAFFAALPKEGEEKKEIGGRFIRELESVVFMLENEESRMYSASLLFVYEGDKEARGRAREYEERKAAARAKAEAEGKGDGGGVEDEDEDDGDVEVEVPEGAELDENDEEIEPKLCDVRMIDFAHARWAKGEGRDENALRGVRSCLDVFNRVVGGPEG